MRGTGVVFTSPLHADLEHFELDPKSLAPREVLVESEISLVSPGTESSYFTGVMTHAPSIYTDVPPFAGAGATEGHEMFPARTGYANVGVVRAVGAGVDPSMLGRRVFTMSRHASLAVCDLDFLAVELPEGLEPRQAVFARLAGVGITALRAAGASAGDRVAVIGLGLVGNLCAQLLQLAGCDVVGFDPDRTRRELAQRCGIGSVVDPVEHDPVEWVRAWTGRGVAGGAAITVEATGRASLAAQAIEMTAAYGSVVLLGSPRVAQSFDVTPALARLHWLAISMVGGLEWRYPIAAESPRARFTIEDNYRQILRWIADGRLVIDPLITHVLSPVDCQVAYAGIVDDPEHYVGVLFDWTSTESETR